MSDYIKRCFQIIASGCSKSARIAGMTSFGGPLKRYFYFIVLFHFFSITLRNTHILFLALRFHHTHQSVVR